MPVQKKKSKRTTLRRNIKKDLREMQRTAQRCRRALESLPEELLDMPLAHVFSWFWKSGGEVHLSCDAGLGEEKGAEDFRSVSAQLLALSGKSKVETTLNEFYPGRFDQRFILPGINVNLFWTDPELKKNPCHKMMVTRIVELAWCGEGDPPLQDGDVIIEEDSDAG